MADKINPQEFWDEKITGWEDGRYDEIRPSATLLEKIANCSSASLRFRMAITGSPTSRGAELSNWDAAQGCWPVIYWPAVHCPTRALTYRP